MIKITEFGLCPILSNSSNDNFSFGYEFKMRGLGVVVGCKIGS
jgi:hypothetical protein